MWMRAVTSLRAGNFNVSCTDSGWQPAGGANCSKPEEHWEGSVRQRDFWIGFTWGATAAVGGALIASRLGRGGASRILRLEKSIQIARPAAEVFDAWVDIEQLPMMIEALESVSSIGHRSHWNARIKGMPVQWDAELTQLIPNQAIGWKSVRGPKHSG